MILELKNLIQNIKATTSVARSHDDYCLHENPKNIFDVTLSSGELYLDATLFFAFNTRISRLIANIAVNLKVRDKISHTKYLDISSVLCLLE